MVQHRRRSTQIGFPAWPSAATSQSAQLLREMGSPSTASQPLPSGRLAGMRTSSRDCAATAIPDRIFTANAPSARVGSPHSGVAAARPS